MSLITAQVSKAEVVFRWGHSCVMFAEFRLGEKQKVHLLAIIADLWVFFVKLEHKPLKFTFL